MCGPAARRSPSTQKRYAGHRIGIEERKTDTGKMKISSVELTFLDLLRYPQAGAGLDNISTVFPDHGFKVNIEGLSALCHAFERSVMQRAGTSWTRPGSLTMRRSSTH